LGKPSNKIRKAQRPGRNERARVKKHYRVEVCLINHVAGAGTVHIKAGRKKFDRAYRAVSRLSGESLTPNAIVSIQWPACRIGTHTKFFGCL
jgi:hypothetical protein